MVGQSQPVGEDLAELQIAIQQADVVADAFLGTGHSRPLDPTMGAALALVQKEKQRRSELLQLAVDLPSGLNADTGALDEGASPADLTVTLAFPKVGLLLFPGASYMGELRTGSIGLPPEMPIDAGMELLDPELLHHLLPKRPLDSNKGTFGKVMVLAGSSAYIGAAYLATAAAARIGAGLVTLATTEDRALYYATLLPEATYVLLPPASSSPQERVHALLDHLQGYHALIVGPGLGQSEATQALLGLLFDGLRALPAIERPRLLVDADGLNNLARIARWWERLPAHTALTPHPGEMSRLLGGTKVSGGGPDRLEVARNSARVWGHVVVLKGASTLIASPEGGVLRVNWPGNPALASAGTGDVLSGTVGGLLAQGLEPFDAASAAVYLHSRAGLRVSARLGDAGLLAGDLLAELPLALRDLKVLR
jgi:NAD(P)H-hydrate epimerase